MTQPEVIVGEGCPTYIILCKRDDMCVHVHVCVNIYLVPKSIIFTNTLNVAYIIAALQ